MAHRASKLLINAFTEAAIISHIEEVKQTENFLSALYLFSVQLHVLHRLGITEEHQLLDNVHLVVDINGFMKPSII